MLDKLKKSHRPYAKKIMNELYPDKHLDADSICSKFVKKYRAIVRASIKDLENCSLLKSTQSKDKPEKIYSLSEKGRMLIEADMPKDIEVLEN
ncbi:winged helix DNA-binding protein [Clostridium sp.]|jgi:ribosomal protein S19E (S16A)|uniref:winged helix DNA-binding protein n=1 Tax=Clostridium sp. TaxID=1506 RepID=UPI0039F5941C